MIDCIRSPKDNNTNIHFDFDLFQSTKNHRYSFRRIDVAHFRILENSFVPVDYILRKRLYSFLQTKSMVINVDLHAYDCLFADRSPEKQERNEEGQLN